MAGERLVVGLVRGVHGLRGALRVEILTDNAARFEPGSILFVEGDDRPLTVASAQRDGPGLMVHFREISSREAADRLREMYLEAPAGELSGETFYWHDIIGLAVETTAGEQVGTVADVFRVGESEVYVVRGPRREVLVPGVRSVVVELSPAAGKMVVDAQALDLEPDPAEKDTE